MLQQKVSFSVISGDGGGSCRRPQACIINFVCSYPYQFYPVRYLRIYCESGIASDDLVVAPGIAKSGIQRFVTARVECSCAGALISVL